MKKGAIWGVAMACLVLVALGLGVLALGARSRARPWNPVGLSATHLGVTNDGTSPCHARFAISNAGRSTVVRLSTYRLQWMTNGEWRELNRGWLGTGDSVIQGGAGEVVGIPCPTGSVPWRVVFSIQEADGMLYSMATELLLEAQKLGWPTRYQRRSRGGALISPVVQEAARSEVPAGGFVVPPP